MKDFFGKYCYFIYPFITIIMIISLFSLCSAYSINLQFVDDFNTNAVTICGTLIGFLLTALTIFFGLPKDTKVMQRAKKYGHHIIFSKCIFLGMASSILSILFWCFNLPEIFVFLCLVISIEETVISAKYIYKLCIYNFE